MRHRRAEQAFGRNLDMHIDVPTFYEVKDKNGDRFSVFNQNTGDIIEKYFDEAERQGINASFSICIVPPKGATKGEVSKAISTVFSGEVDGLPMHVLQRNIDKISMSVDFEYMVMGDAYENDGPINYIPLDLVHDINKYYIYLHQAIQSSKPLSWDILFVPHADFYNFGVGASDDMFVNMGESSSEFPENTRIISDAIGTADFKALSVRNFAEEYKVDTSPMFFIAGPTLRDDGKQSDRGIRNYNDIVEWTRQHSQSNRAGVH